MSGYLGRWGKPSWFNLPYSTKRPVQKDDKEIQDVLPTAMSLMGPKPVIARAEPTGPNARSSHFEEVETALGSKVAVKQPIQKPSSHADKKEGEVSMGEVPSNNVVTNTKCRVKSNEYSKSPLKDEFGMGPRLQFPEEPRGENTPNEKLVAQQFFCASLDEAVEGYRGGERYHKEQRKLGENKRKPSDASETHNELPKYFTAFSAIRTAEQAVKDLRKKYSTSSNQDDERGRGQFMIESSINELNVELARFGPNPNSVLRKLAAEIAQRDKPDDQDHKENSVDTSKVSTHGLLAPLDSQHTASPFFTVLPAEIRRHIYRELLCTPRTIRGGDLVEEKRTMLVIIEPRQPHQDIGIDSTLLRTCRKIYGEALPILYEENEFGFCDVNAIRAFRTGDLTLMPRK